MKVKMGFLESMARDMRHPYIIPSTTVLGDIYKKAGQDKVSL